MAKVRCIAERIPPRILVMLVIHGQIGTEPTKMTLPL